MDSDSDTEGYYQSSDGQSDFEGLETSVNVEASAAPIASTSRGGVVDTATGRLAVEAPDSSDDSAGSLDADTSGSSTDEDHLGPFYRSAMRPTPIIVHHNNSETFSSL